ncbi:MAG: ribosome biogenesis GTPase YlqF [Clostridiaceae bacterium]|jgi:ribosome biogenesis GTPase A|nr:ribosome biogenesis GTPase YlqF [Clostridiaceae bacterium]
MKIIQWFPGHMTKAVRMMQDGVKLVDAVIYVIDARAVAASDNPKFNDLIAGKRVLYVFNKADLVEKKDLEPWFKRFTAEHKIYAAANSAGGDVANVVGGLRAAVADIVERYAAKGVNKSIRAMVVGVPNSGKSTMINSLCRSKKTMTGDRPGVTRGGQWVRVDKYIDILDTPGTLWASFENQEYARDLAYIGSIKDDILDKTELVAEFIKKIAAEYPDCLKTRYGVDADVEQDTLLERIIRARGFLLRGGEPDIERGSAAILDDFRKGRLGKIMLEKAPK